MSAARSLAVRLAVAGAVAFVVAGLIAGAALLAPAGGGGGGVAAGPEHPAYEADRLNPERLESSGEADPRGDVGTVLFDRTHENRFDDEDVAALERAIEDAGGDVRYTGLSTGFREQLQAADVLVVVDPGTSYGPQDVDAVERFVDDGGRVVLLGEPNRKRLQSDGLQATLTTERSKLTTVASPFGISVGSAYLYDMEHNDGNFKNVVVSPPDGTGADAVQGVDRVALYTAATVEADRGTVLLRTAPSAERAGGDARNGYPVAVRSAGGNVLAVGDTTFLGEEYHNVVDNDVFLGRIVEFMAGADHSPAGGGSGGSAGTDGGEPNGSDGEGDGTARLAGPAVG